MPGHTTNRRTLSSRTTAGSYRAPVQGIVDFDAFEKGFDSAFDIEAFDREVPEWVKLDQEIGASKFDSGTGTPATGNFEGQTENLHTDVLEQSMIDTYVKNNRTNKYLKGNEEDKERALQDLEALKDFLAKKGTVYTAIGDSNTYDLELSKNAPVLDENGEAIIYKGKNGKDVKLTWGMMNSVHGKPDAKYNRRIEQRSISKGGVDLQPVIGEVITLGEGENAKEYFINYSAINDEYISEHFKIKYNHASNLAQANKKITNPSANQKTKSTTDVEILPGDPEFEIGKTKTKQEVTETISPDYYDALEKLAAEDAKRVFNFVDGVDGIGYSSAINQLFNTNFTFSQDVIDKIKEEIPSGELENFNNFIKQDRNTLTAKRLKTYLTANQSSSPVLKGANLLDLYDDDGKIGIKDVTKKIKVIALQDWYAESVKYTNAPEAYRIDKDTNRAEKIKTSLDEKETIRKRKLEENKGGLSFNFGGIGVDQNLYNVISETDKFGRSDDVAGTLFFTKDLPTGDNQKPRFDQEMLVSVNPSASGGKEKQVIFNLNKGDNKPKFIIYDFGYSMAEDAPRVYLDKEGNPVEKGSRGAIEVIPKTAQEYVQSRFSSEANQNKYSNTINEIYDARKKNFAKKQNFMRNWRRNNPSPQITGETDEDYKIRLKQEELNAYNEAVAALNQNQ